MSQIRVLQISSGFAIEGPSGGLGRFAMELSRKLDQTKVELILCGLWNHGTPVEQQRIAQLQREGIEAFTAADFNEATPYRQFFAAYRTIVKRFSGQTIDIIHSHDQFGDILALLLKPVLHTKALIRTVHNEREWARRPFRYAFLTGVIYPLMYHYEVGVSQQVVDNLNQRPFAKLARQKAVRIYNSLDLTRFQDIQMRSRNLLNALFIPDDCIVLCTIGRLVEQKGYDFLLDAMKCLVAIHQNVKLLIVGDGPLRKTLQEKSEKEGLGKYAIFMGSRSDVENILSISDLFVSSSLWEGLPTVIIESMAAGVPVIATDVSGTRELIEEGVTGYLVKPGDATALCARLSDIINRLDESAPLVTRANAEINHRFSIETAAEDYINLYLEST